VNKPRNSRFHRGVGLVEAMISLSIAASLLVAVAGAYRASAAAVETNEDFFRATQAARTAMLQLQTAIRRCDSCQVYSTTQLDVFTHDLKQRRYQYDAGPKELRFIKTDETGSPTYVLAKNVTGVSFVADTENGIVTRVTITLDVGVGNERIHLAGSAVPRRSLTY